MAATATLGASEGFLTNDEIPRDELDDMADLMDDHLNDALSGIFTEEGSEESSCTSSVYSLSDDWW